MTNIDGLYNKDVAKSYFDRKHFVDGKLTFEIFERATILPHANELPNKRKPTWGGFGGLVDNKGNRVTMSPNTTIYEPKTLKKSSETVIFLGMFSDCWGHDITYNISRLWFLRSADFKREFKNCPIVYAPFQNKVAGYHWLNKVPNIKRLFEILEIDADSLRPISEPTQFEKVILPNASFFGKNSKADFKLFFTAEYRETVDRLREFALKNRMPTADKKIYYFHGRRQIGEERLAEYFRSKGYAIVRPERLTLDEQLNLLINADSFASTLGSCSHNSIFLRDGTETIFIPRVAHFTAYQQAIDKVHSLKTNYIDSTLSLSDKLHSAACYIISRNLKEFFGDDFKDYAEDDFKIFLTYIKALTGAGLKLNETALQYYAPILQDFFAQLKAREDLLKAYGVTIN